jgi:hypothetical protein
LALQPVLGQDIDGSDPTIIALRDNHLKGPILATETLNYIAEIRRNLAELEPSAQRSFLLANVEYFHGMYFYQMEDYRNAEPLLVKAENLTLKLLQEHPHSEVHRLYAEVLGLKMLMGGIGAIISNVFSLEFHLEEALRMDRRNIRAALIANLKYVHASLSLVRTSTREKRSTSSYSAGLATMSKSSLSVSTPLEPSGPIGEIRPKLWNGIVRPWRFIPETHMFWVKFMKSVMTRRLWDSQCQPFC